MNDQVIMVAGAVLLIVVGVQTYMIFQLNDKIKQLSQQDDSPFPFKLTLIDPFSDNQFWNLYEEIQRMQAQMEQIFGDSFSCFHGNHPFGSFDENGKCERK